jgi:hypothetical protein
VIPRYVADRTRIGVPVVFTNAGMFFFLAGRVEYADAVITTALARAHAHQMIVHSPTILKDSLSNSAMSCPLVVVQI